MNRLDFLKKGLSSLGFVVALPLIDACKTDDSVTPTTNTGTTNTTCSVTNSETAGPFPTKDPSSLVMNNIASGKTGTALTINITIKNTNNSCTSLANAIVDIWHCDAEGNYSEYGGTNMQSTNYTAVHFLRGRQTTSSAGLASWISIFPGWYSGRAPHIHVHIYNASGTSLLVTQIAFPKDVCDIVYAQGAYASRGLQNALNSNDSVFSDGVTNELATITGSVSAGYVLTHTIYV